MCSAKCSGKCSAKCVLRNVFRMKCSVECSAKCVLRVFCEVFREMCSTKCSTKCVPWNVFRKMFHEMCSLQINVNKFYASAHYLCSNTDWMTSRSQKSLLLNCNRCCNILKYKSVIIADTATNVIVDCDLSEKLSWFEYESLMEKTVKD